MRPILPLLPLLLVALPLALHAEEFALPDFDERAKATVVVSAPAKLDRTKRYPLLLDFHGAIDPRRRGGTLTSKHVWAKFVTRRDWIVAAPNSRRRSWGAVPGDKNDLAYADAVLAEVRKRYPVDPDRIYVAGFSSGSDFICKSKIQARLKVAGTLVVCPGPPSVVGLRKGELASVARQGTFVFATGEEDYIRKDGAWQAFLAVEKAGGTAIYREVPGLGHKFPTLDEYVALIDLMAGYATVDKARAAPAAFARGDLLRASSFTTDKALLAKIEARGQKALAAAKAIDGARDPGRAFEAWWRIATQYHRFDALAAPARAAMAALKKQHKGIELLRARRAWFRRRAAGGGPPPKEHKGRTAPGTRERKIVARPRVGEGLWAFDRYVDHDTARKMCAELAARYPARCKLSVIGKSLGGRPIECLTITDFASGAPETKPAIYLQAGIHGNEVSTVTAALYAAYRLVATNGRRSRGTERALERTTFYIVPVVNPDALQAHINQPNTHWRPRFNMRPTDSDRDGTTDENPVADLNGDGQIGMMYAPDAKGFYVRKGQTMVRARAADKRPRYRLVGRESRDTDGDGKYGEDGPGGVDLNRNYPVGWAARHRFGGSSGSAAGSEPETKAVLDFVSARPHIALFLDAHNDGHCVFVWQGPACRDADQLGALAQRCEDGLGWPARPLTHAGAGLAQAWAYGARGIPGLILELEPARGDRETYSATVWKGADRQPLVDFDHPQLGKILLGADFRKLARRNPHPRDIGWQADRIFQWLKREAARLPRLVFERPRIRYADGVFHVTGALRNAGSAPMDTAQQTALTLGASIRLTAEGATLDGTTTAPALAAGATAPFRLSLTPTGGTIALVARHPRGGSARLVVSTPRRPTVPIRKTYTIAPGYATVETARQATNAHWKDGAPTGPERGPAFKLLHREKTLKVAVILAEWADRKHVVPAATFRKALLSVGAYRDRSHTGQPVYGSARDLFREMSYGGFDLDGTVFDWVTIPGKHEDYVKASFGSPRLSRAALAALLAREGKDALDGYRGVILIWAGNAVTRLSCLWPMRIKLAGRPGVVAVKLSELFKGEMAPVGVPCHELCHTFGVNDKYGLGAGTRPLGMYCLVCKGTHGAAPSGRHRPFHLCAWCKSVIGWVKPAVIDPSTPQKLALRPIGYGPREAYRILLRPDGEEYLLLENRRREGWHSDLPSPGLLVLRCGPNDKLHAPQVRCQLIPAHGLPPRRRSDVARPEAVAWPRKDRTELVTDGVRLSQIRRVDDVVYFEVGPARR